MYTHRWRSALATTVHRAGELAYLDTFSGLVPCRVLAVHGAAPRAMLTVTVTATRGAYGRGEVLEDRLDVMVVPRRHIVTRNGRLKIVGSWQWQG
jgi:hypothetical protein